MNEKLILNNGTELTGHLIESNGKLFVYLFNIAYVDAIELLIVPENVEKIEWEQFEQKGTVTGYTDLYSISKSHNGMISAAFNRT